jgi:hypothetical protein
MKCESNAIQFGLFLKNYIMTVDVAKGETKENNRPLRHGLCLFVYTILVYYY